MLVTLSGIVTLVRDEHPRKAESPMLVTLSGIVTLVRDSQPEKAQSPMLVTLSGIVSTPSLSSVQVRLLPLPSAPQVPLATMSAASAVAGRSDAIISTASTKLKSRFLMCFPPIGFSPVILLAALPRRRNDAHGCAPNIPGVPISTWIITLFIKYAIQFTLLALAYFSVEFAHNSN